MKKFLSILLAVMMVLSTVSFAAPSLAGSADSALEVPVVEVPAEETAEAELAADTEWDNPAFGTLVAEVNFDNLTTSSDLAELKGRATENTTVTALGGKVNPNFEAGKGNVFFFDTSGADRYTNMEVVQDANLGTYFKATITNNTKTAFDFRTVDPNQFVSEDGYFTLTLDVKASKDNMISFRYNRSHNAEDHVSNSAKETKTKAGEWVTVVSRYDSETIGTSTHNPPIAGTQEINHILFYTQGAGIGDTIEMDNWRLYYYPKTVSYTVDLSAYGKDDVEITNVNTATGKTAEELAALLPKIDNLVFIGFSATEGGKSFGTNVYVDGATVYPVYEERVALNGSLEFDNASDLSKITLRNGSNNANSGSFLKVENGSLVATFEGANPERTLQDTGFSFAKVNVPATALEYVEMKIKVTGMPETNTTLIEPNGNGRNFTVASVNFPQIYYMNYGETSVKTNGEGYRTDLTNANGEWRIYKFTPDNLGFNGLSFFRVDFYDFMPSGSTVEIDYIRFIGKPIRVTVDNGDNKSAPAVKMDLTSTTTVAEVEAMYAKDHGDMKFVGLSRTPGGAVLASSELVSATGEATTLYAIWDDYEYLTHYSVEFNNEAEEAHKVRINQNNAETSYEWNKDGYLTLKAVPKAGYEATWDHQIFVETIKPETALVPGVVSEVAVRMRYRNIPTESAVYTVQGRETYTDAQRTLNPRKAPAYVHIAKATATKWGEQLQSNNVWLDLEENQWFVKYYDAETFFKDGLAYARFDTTYPLRAGMEVDVDYIRFIGDNEDERIPGGNFTGAYGEKVFSVDFDDATVGELGANTNVANLGLEKNSWLLEAANGITFNVGASGGKTAPTKLIKEKADGDKYFEYTLNAESTYSYFFFSAGASEFVRNDGYFVVTYDIKSTDGNPVTFRMNQHDQVQDVAENFEIIENGEWDKVVLYYDAQIGSSTQNGYTIDSTNDISVVKWHPNGTSKVGQTVAIDNFTLWFVPKTVNVTIDLSAYDVDNVVIKDYPTKGMSRADLEKTLPYVKDYEIMGLSLTEGGDALYENRVCYDATLYPVYEKVNVLDYTKEFNSYDDIAAIKAMSSNSMRLGKNSALNVDQQYKIVTEDGYTFLRMENQSLDGETGAVVDYGFWITNALEPSLIKQIVINMRVSKWAAAGKYTRENGTEINFNPASMIFQLYFMNETGGTVKKEINPRVNATELNGEWFTVSINGADIPADAKVFRLDPPDFLGHGTVIDVDYVRFYGEPIPDSVPLKWSADFDTSEAGLGLTSWKKEDGSYMYDDGVNGDFGVGTGSAFIGNADNYITWNEEGYVTLNFVANEEVKAAAAEKGATAFVYDASAYVASLDKASYIPAGSFEDVRIRMRFRDLPADDTALYGLAYSNWQEHTWNFNDPSNYFYFHYSNAKGGTLYEGATATKQSYDGMTFTKGSYAPNTWFEVTIPASYFKADENPLEILRLNIPNWMPDGSKIDIDYIKFYGKAPEATAPVTDSNVTFRVATADVTNAIRFKGVITADTEAAVSNIGWLVTRAAYLENAGLTYNDLDVTAAEAAGGKIIVAYNRENGVDNAGWYESDDMSFTFAAALKNIPAANALDILVIRTLVKAPEGEYLYGNTIETSLYDVAIAPYINFISEYYGSFEEMVDDGATYEDAFSFGDIEYNNDYNALSEAQQTYIDDVLKGLLG